MKENKNMNETNEQQLIKTMVEDFTKVLQFSIITTIKNHYGSLEKFKVACNDKSNLSLQRYNKNFHFDSKILQSLTRDNKGKRHLDKVLANLDSSKLVYKHKCTIKYKSGKKFTKPSTFYIPFNELNRLFNLEFEKETPFKTSSSYYTEKQHDLIDKLIFKFKKNSRKQYTKSEKFYESVKNRRLKTLATKPEETLSDTELKELIDAVI